MGRSQAQMRCSSGTRAATAAQGLEEQCSRPQSPPCRARLRHYAPLISRYQFFLSVVIVPRCDQRAGPSSASWLLPRSHVSVSHTDQRDFAVMSQAHLACTRPRHHKDKGPCVTFLFLPLWNVIKHPSAWTAYQCSWTITDAAFSEFSYHSPASALGS